uniref:Mucin-associated surface protein (MASP) n=1 Tax=Gasterosteus aculeatus TaxID=69293 RepID=G3QCJ3_GASAC
MATCGKMVRSRGNVGALSLLICLQVLTGGGRSVPLGTNPTEALASQNPNVTQQKPQNEEPPSQWSPASATQSVPPPGDNATRPGVEAPSDAPTDQTGHQAHPLNTMDTSDSTTEQGPVSNGDPVTPPAKNHTDMEEAAATAASATAAKVTPASPDAPTTPVGVAQTEGSQTTASDSAAFTAPNPSTALPRSDTESYHGGEEDGGDEEDPRTYGGDDDDGDDGGDDVYGAADNPKEDKKAKGPGADRPDTGSQEVDSYNMGGRGLSLLLPPGHPGFPGGHCLHQLSQQEQHLPPGSEPPLEGRPVFPEHGGVPPPGPERPGGHAVPQDDPGLRVLIASFAQDVSACLHRGI